jgi:hypothetical protein
MGSGISGAHRDRGALSDRTQLMSNALGNCDMR